MKKTFFLSLLVGVLIIPCAVLLTACGGGLFGKMKVKSIEVATQPTKAVYVVGEVFNPAGMKIKVEYDDDDNTTKTITVKASWVSSAALDEDGKFAIVGETTVLKVTYEGKTITFTVKVNPAPTTTE